MGGIKPLNGQIGRLYEMSIKSNDELSNAIDKAIKDSGYKRIYIAEQLGIANQNLKRTIHSNLSLDDANKILDIIDYDAEIILKKRLKK